MHRRAILRPLFIALALATPVSSASPAPFPHPQHPPTDPTQIAHRVVLVGDAGDLEGGEELLEKVGRLVAGPGTLLDRTTLVFLGDNFYPKGPEILADDGSSEILLQQLNAGTRHAPTVFVPGNHGWDDSGIFKPDLAAGLKRLLAMEEYVASHASKPGVWMPTAGCPGPEVLDRSGVRLVAIDSEWWLLDEELRARIAKQRRCAWDGDPIRSGDDVIAAIREALACNDSAACPPRILLAHHPIETHGPHGGYFEPSEHLFCFGAIPLPGVCSIDIWARRHGITRQDTASERYGDYIEALDEAMKVAPPLVFAAGHDHSLQVIDRQSGPLLLVSGSAAKQSPVSDKPAFSSSRAGFMVLEFMTDRSVMLRVFESWEQTLAEAYRRQIVDPTP